MSFEAFSADCQSRVNQSLQQILSVDTLAPRLQEAISYSVLNGGKRLRPMLVYAAGETLGVLPEHLDSIACAVELIHAYSLIHDDLPAMDNADLRRGKASCHKKFDEATAILAGDALQALAFEVLTNDPFLASRPQQCLAMIRVLTKACGVDGMVGGQTLDLAATGQTLTLNQLELLHSLKTGALIKASIQLALLAASNVDKQKVIHLERYANDIGLAFQISDDILDIESTTATLGKPQGNDATLGKTTYPQLIGLAAAKIKLEKLLAQALTELEIFEKTAEKLRLITRYIGLRRS